ncbi:MAG: hypothetical protein B0D92_08185 [Spirochaeta sp. LUC14_002_19_P3]|nr:MAG: hypothetical protein B0D92_08185 [Spirochaeta sp. LUC14_002_19_P3]
MNAKEGLLGRNLAALSLRHSRLAAKLSLTEGSSGLEFILSRQGAAVPALRRSGRLFPLHSRFEPIAEGKRIAAEAPRGFITAFGLGGAYHLMPLLFPPAGESGLTGLLIVEKDLAIVRRILEEIDLTRLFSDCRVSLLVDVEPRELSQFLLEHYLPVLYGNFGTISLRSRWDSEQQWFSQRMDALRNLPECLSRDYTVQSRFGCRWFVHTAANLARSEESHCVIPPIKKLLITAAGPSLSGQLERVRQLQKDGASVLATDTSLPVLHAAGIAPDFALSIDCQIISYHHFFRKLPPETTLILDMASPPFLTRQAKRILFYASGHPFSLYLNKHFRPYPLLDVSGGNVTHTAASFAQQAKAEEVRLFGGDFSYPGGQPYSPGSYLYPYFHSQSVRTASSEHRFWEFIARSLPEREKTSSGWRWRTKIMDYYRESLESFIKTRNYTFIQEEGSGVPLSCTPKKPAPGQSPISSPISPERQPWQNFLQHYRNSLRSLPPLTLPHQDYLEKLKPADRQVWATLLPAAAALQGSAPYGLSAVESARHWTIERITALLERHNRLTPV